MVQIRGGAKLEKQLAELTANIKKAASVKVGFLEGATYPDGTPVAMIAAINNFGAPSRGIPPRPFFSQMVQKHGGHWGDDLAELLEATGYDAAKSLALMGEEMKGELREAIIDLMSPPDSPVTDLLKDRFPMGGQTFADVLQARRDVAAGVRGPVSKPLVHTGYLLSRIDSEVT